MILRFAGISDSAEILKIYEQYMDTAITFEYELPTIEEFTDRVRTISAEYPYIVCEDNGRVVGYAYAHRYRERTAYQWGAELSIYIDKSYTSKGLGRKLYGALTEILKLQNVRTVYGCVTVPNEKSEKLHLGMGFRYAGKLNNAGYKNGAWHDVAWFEKDILPYADNPEKIVTIGSADMAKALEILKEYCRY